MLLNHVTVTGDTGGIEPGEGREAGGPCGCLAPALGEEGQLDRHLWVFLSSPTSGCQSQKAQPCFMLLALVLTGCAGPASGPGAGEVSQMSEPKPHLGRVAERHAAQLSGPGSGFIT